MSKASRKYKDCLKELSIRYKGKLFKRKSRGLKAYRKYRRINRRKYENI